MYRTVTHFIQVSVEPHFIPERSSPDDAEYFWTYTIEVANLGDTTVQLMSRIWQITDGNGHYEEVRGEGVVGEQPTLKPGEAFEYTSGVPLRTPSGIMAGSYIMQAGDGGQLEVEVPAFSLDSPHMQHSVN